MTETPSTWDEVRRIADELDVKIHLASMDARDRWQKLQPRLAEVEKTVVAAGTRATAAIDREVANMAEALRKLRDEVLKPTKS